MKKTNKSDLLQKAKEALLKRMRPSRISSDRLSRNGTPSDPGEFALWSIGRHAEAEAARMVISGKAGRLLQEIGQLDGHLRELEIAHTEISDLSPLVGLSNLESLKVTATEIVDWSVLSSLKNLRRLELNYSGTKHVVVPDMSELVEVKILNTHGRITLGNLPKLEKAEFQVLEDLAEVGKQPKLVDLAFQKIANRSLNALTGVANLRQLSARLHGAMDLHSLARHTSLAVLELTGPEVTDISSISELASLETLELNDFNVSNAHSLKELTKLRSLALRFTEQLADLSFLSDMRDLERLVLCPSADSDLSPLTKLPNLQHVALVGISPRTNLSPLTLCKGLRRLSVSSDKNANGPLLGLLPAPPNLERLSLSGHAIDSLNGLERCRELQSLHCFQTTIDSLEPLKGMPQLRQVHVSRSNVSDLSVLATLPYFLAEEQGIKLSLRDTPAVKQYPELEKTVSSEGSLAGYEYDEHETAVNAVRAVTCRT
ncbi:leucine-rich repeat domain-containing protein [Cochlodiniinecator piscidefendens]|uniref:hypothetical protein n=1 Tax=Cochlodiniinecator piscidefendens TaxID=2715756 RepID=UPI0014077DA0|nr:hypothetical protein [Cochlodiniinecator piscidefendens]